jgi:hypothetical protein
MVEIVLGREPESCWVVVDTYDCIDTSGVVFGLEALLEFLDLNNGRALVGAIELSKEEIVLAIQALQTNLETNDGT